MTGENNPYISNLFVDSDEHSLCTDVFLREGGRLYTGYDEHSVILILDKCSVGFRISRGGFRIPGTGFRTLWIELGLLIPIVSGIPDSLSCIPDSKAKDSSYGHNQKPPGFLNFLGPVVRGPDSDPLRRAKIQTTPIEFSLPCRQ